VIPWDRLAASVEEAKHLVRPDGPDYLAIATRGHAIIRQIGPLFLGAFDFRAVPAAASALRAIKMLRAYYDAGRRTWPASLPTGFIKRSWHDAVMTPQGLDRKAYEMCVFAELRDRLRAGDIWVVGSRRFRAVEDQLIARPLFEAMQTAGPLPVALPASAADYLAERRTVLQQRLAEVDGKAAQNQLVDVRINEAGLKITPLRAITPEQAEALAQQLYDLVPTVRISVCLLSVYSCPFYVATPKRSRKVAPAPTCSPPPATTTAPPSGAGSPLRSASSRTTRRQDRSTDRNGPVTTRQPPSRSTADLMLKTDFFENRRPAPGRGHESSRRPTT
jgi:hypothetical protein